MIIDVVMHQRRRMDEFHRRRNRQCFIRRSRLPLRTPTAPTGVPDTLPPASRMSPGISQNIDITVHNVMQQLVNCVQGLFVTHSARLRRLYLLELSETIISESAGYCSIKIMGLQNNINLHNILQYSSKYFSLY